ncbi:ubiquitin carboxyl-terminal hydrolase family protein [Tasmannia lanceolata]|uniref:ubiquitin carboxyl-terminal hydrolase family protein n=1 Tax=Tasmannia lanceolata TaxID=3420 RepID=UPI004062889C
MLLREALRQRQQEKLLVLSHCCNFSYEQKRSLVNVKLKWVKDTTLDSVVAGETELRTAWNLKDKIANDPRGYLPIYELSRRRRQLGLSHVRVSRFMRRYPTIFHEFIQSSNSSSPTPCFRLTDQALQLHQEELEILQNDELELIQRLRKLLMLTTNKTLPLETVDQFQWDMGLPYHYQQTLIPRYPQFFKFVHLPPTDRIALQLSSWDDIIAISQLQKDTPLDGDFLAFPIKFTRGFGLKRKCMAWLQEWQKLPYTSPYANASDLDPRTDVSEKRIVGVFHELLHLTIGKKTDRTNVRNLRKPLSLPHKFTKVFGRHPGIFYISHKCDTQTVILREAYDGRELLQKHPLVEIRGRFVSMMRTGRLNRSRGLYKKLRDDDDHEGEDCKLQIMLDDFKSGGSDEECEYSSDCNLLSYYDFDDNSGEVVEEPC